MIPYNSRLVQISRASGAICSWAFTNDIEPERTKRFATALAHSALMPTGRRSSGSRARRNSPGAAFSPRSSAENSRSAQTRGPRTVGPVRHRRNVQFGVPAANKRARDPASPGQHSSPDGDGASALTTKSQRMSPYNARDRRCSGTRPTHRSPLCLRSCATVCIAIRNASRCWYSTAMIIRSCSIDLHEATQRAWRGGDRTGRGHHGDRHEAHTDYGCRSMANTLRPDPRLIKVTAPATASWAPQSAPTRARTAPPRRENRPGTDC